MTQISSSDSELMVMSPQEFRRIARQEEWQGQTRSVCKGYAQANLVIVPNDMAFELLLFCVRNPRPCPVLDVTQPGDPHPSIIAPDADVRTDLPKYRVYKDGKLIAEPTNIIDYWRDDLVAFLLGCSISANWSLTNANLPYRNIGIYNTDISCIPSGRFHGPLVVSARLFNSMHDVIRATQITSRLPAAHGPPIHIGDATIIGIKDLYKPDVDITGPVKPLEHGEVVAYWGCGVTLQAMAVEVRLPFIITQYPAHMFVTDKLTEELTIL